MSLNGIAASALSALQTNQTALGVVANNVSNLNTPGYARRVVNEQTLSANGQLVGVDIGSITRVADQFLSQEMFSANGTASQYDAQSTLFTQLNGLLGRAGRQPVARHRPHQPGVGLRHRVPGPQFQRQPHRRGQRPRKPGLQHLQCVGHHLLDAEPDRQPGGQRDLLDQFLIKQVFDLNTQIRASTASGGNPSALADQRDVALGTLSQTLGIRTSQNSDGSLNVSTTDGINLVSNTYATLSIRAAAVTAISATSPSRTPIPRPAS